MFAQLNNASKDHIFATSRNTFISRTTGMKMHIDVTEENEEAGGDVYLPIDASLTGSGENHHGYAIIQVSRSESPTQ